MFNESQPLSRIERILFKIILIKSRFSNRHLVFSRLVELGRSRILSSACILGVVHESAQLDL